MPKSTVTRSAQIPLKSAAASADAVTLEFLGEPRLLCVRGPGALRIQQTDIGLSRRSRSMRSSDQVIRLAFRATALPEQLDGLAPGELTADPIPAECNTMAAPATHPSVRDES